MERHAALAAIIAIVAGRCLLAMDAVLGVIDSEHDDRGWGGVGGDTLLQHHSSHAVSRQEKLGVSSRVKVPVG